MDDLTISIGTIANFDGLEECLQSIFSEDDPHFTFKVNLVFNGSREEDRIERIKNLFPQVSILRSRHKLGWPRNHNQTLNRYESRYVLLLDDDTLLPKSTLPTMVRFMDDHPEVGIAGCETEFPDGTFQKIYGLMPSIKIELLYAFNISSYWPNWLYQNIKGWREVDWLNGHFMMARSEAIREAGTLDEFYYTYYSEPDWCYRIHKAGWQVAYLPDTKITHVGGEHSSRSRFKKSSHIVRSYINRYYFFSKHYNPFAFFCLRPITIIGAFLRLIKFLLVFALSSERRNEARQKIVGYLKVIRLGVSLHPIALPEELSKENALAMEGL
jgi:GT2 family glycosyltransferase